MTSRGPGGLYLTLYVQFNFVEVKFYILLPGQERVRTLSGIWRSKFLFICGVCCRFNLNL